MDNEYWHQKWQSKDIGFNQLQPHKLLQRYFSSLQINAGAGVFLPLCGQSIDILWLAEQGYRVVGVELSQIACDAFFAEHNLAVNITEIDNFIVYNSNKITIFCGDFFKFKREIIGQIDAVYDRAALVALPTSMHKIYINHLIELINVSTKILLITTAYNQSEMQGPPFSINENDVNALFSTQFSINQLYSKQFKAPAHLQAKGLLNASEKAFLLTHI